MKSFRASLLLAAIFCLALAPVATGAQSSADAAPIAQTHAKAEPSKDLVIRAGGKTASFSLSDLQKLPQKTVSVHNAHSNQDETYSGVVLTDLLGTVAGPASKALGRSLLHSYVKAEGADGYSVLYSGIEIEAASHLGDTIVAIASGGAPLTANGAFMLVSTEDKKPQRWVRNLSSLTLTKPE